MRVAISLAAIGLYFGAIVLFANYVGDSVHTVILNLVALLGG